MAIGMLAIIAVSDEMASRRRALPTATRNAITISSAVDTTVMKRLCISALRTSRSASVVRMLASDSADQAKSPV